LPNLKPFESNNLAMIKLPSVLVLGGTTFDHIAYLNELPQGQPTTIHQCRFQETTGSTGTGKAIALHQLGVPVHLLSSCGNDNWGKEIRKYLEANGLSFHLFEDPKGTERHVNLMDAEGKRISIFITNSSEEIELPENYLEQQLAVHDVIVLNIIAYCRPWAAVVAKCGKPVWTDLHDYDGASSYHQPFIDAAQYIHLSSDNLIDHRSLMEHLVESGKKLVVCTHGKAGASLLDKETGWIEVPAEQVPIVDTNGAGDNFFAGFVYGWLKGKDLVSCMQFGTRAAATCVQSSHIVSPALDARLL
jgi:sugar/nucleoside kinase (ribokinase family)